MFSELDNAIHRERDWIRFESSHTSMRMNLEPGVTAQLQRSIRMKGLRTKGLLIT